MISDSAARLLADAIGATQRPQRQSTQATGVVTEAENGVSVRIDGSTLSTPVAETACSVEVGDRVNVTIGGGKTVITGNLSKPATDDTLAGEAMAVAIDGTERAREKAEEANKAVSDLWRCMTGFVQAYAGKIAPEGWLLCDGSAVSRTTFSRLFAVIGTTYGSGNGSTTFNIPNMGARVPVGSATLLGIKANTYDDRGTIAAQPVGFAGWPIGEYGGEDYHTLQTSEMPSHSHTGSGSQYFVTSDNSSMSNAQFVISTSGTMYTDAATAKDKFHHYRSTATAGSGGRHNICQPYVTVNYIICTGGQ